MKNNMSNNKFSPTLCITLSLSLLSLGYVFYQREVEKNRIENINRVKGLVQRAIKKSIGNDDNWSRDEKREFLDDLGMKHVPLSEKGVLYLIPLPNSAQIYTGIDKYDRLNGSMDVSTNHYQGIIERKMLEEYISKNR